MNQEELLATRYGKKARNKSRDRLVIITIATVSLVTFLIWAIAVTAESSGKPKGNLISFEIKSDTEVAVEVQVENHRNQDTTCQIEALAEDYEVVGYKEIQVTKDETQTRADLITVRPAVSAVVKDCWFN